MIDQSLIGSRKNAIRVVCKNPSCFKVVIVMSNVNVGSSSVMDETVVSSARRFTPAIVDFLQQSVGQIAISGQTPADAWFIELPRTLRQVVIEAGFMGFPRVSRLSRALYNAVPLFQTQVNAKTSVAIAETLRLLLVLCRSPEERTQTNVESAIEILQAALSVDRSELVKPLNEYERDGQWEAVNQAVGGVANHVGHHDASIYSCAVIDSLDRCAEEESWTVAQLASVAEDLACSTEKMRPAHRLMTVLRGHRFFQNVDRLCLVGLVRGSNQLIVVDSCISQRLRSYRDENPMVRGYSCFVNPQGSLFRMKPGVLRVFDDCSRVLDSFASQGKPAQRSIAHIADTGLRSGLCLAIGRGESVQGFLFMNSQHADLFRDVTTRFAPLLSLFSLLGTVAFDAAGFHADRRETLDDHLPKHSVEFSGSEFAEMVKATVLKNSELATTVNVRMIDTPRFLYLPRTVVGMIAELIEKLGVNQRLQDIELIVQRCGEHFAITWEHGRPSGVDGSYLQRAAEHCRAKYAECPVFVDIQDHSVCIRFPAEPVFACSGGCAYSVAY